MGGVLEPIGGPAGPDPGPGSPAARLGCRHPVPRAPRCPPCPPRPPLSPDAPPEAGRPVFVTGATGYIGGRLVPRLLQAGYSVRCLARDGRKLAARPWAGDARVAVVQGDVADGSALVRAMRGCGAAYYLVHSMMAAKGHFSEVDLGLARTFAAAAAEAGLSRIVYLGGLGETGEGLSEHLASRREVEHALAEGPVPVTALRAAIILGAGSASFEILRYLVERLPVMVTPRWVGTECQPIAVENVLHYLVACLGQASTAGRTIDVGGPEVLTYREMMREMARARGLPARWVVPVPFFTPRLSSLWIHLVTPLSSAIARPLAEGLRNRVVCRNDDAVRWMPQRLLPVREAIEAALASVAAGHVETAWSDAGVMPGDPDWAGGTVYEDRRETPVLAEPSLVHQAVCRVGGATAGTPPGGSGGSGARSTDLVGGPGLRRGRRDPERVAYGDALDFWRVTGVEEGRRLDLRAEMRLPGEALLSFEIRPRPGGAPGSILVQTARFKPRGLMGILYWAAVRPLHAVVFDGMLRGIRLTAERMAAAAGPTSGPGGGSRGAR